jgi:hypothetical protein
MGAAPYLTLHAHDMKLLFFPSQADLFHRLRPWWCCAAGLLLLLFAVPAKAQSGAGSAEAGEVLRSPGYAPVLMEAHRNWKAQQQAASGMRSSGGRDTLCLPFFEDFSNPRFRLTAEAVPCDDTVHRSNPTVYPSDVLWADELAYVNADYGIDPPSIGVATLDGLKANGRPYNELSPFGPADSLTSKPIRLGDPSLSDVYLSFYYQPAGRGDNPEPGDSLILEAFGVDSVWHWLWSVSDSNGTIFDPFRLVMFPLDSASAAPGYWRHDAFRFRFRNKASRNGNNDHWHLDYILLDADRDPGDTLFRDVAFVERPPSMLKRYREMPWRQFRDHQLEALAPDMQARVYNNFNTANNTNFQDSLLHRDSGTLIGLSPSESAAVPPMGFNTYFHANQEVPASVPGYDEDTMNLQWKLRLRPSDDINPWNDTLLVEQAFRNYYAYDDGTAERAYGLIGTGAKLAQRYETFEPDTLYAVYIHWAFVNGGVGDKFFSLIVFQSIDTTGLTDSDSVLYQEDFLVPRYPDSINGWHVYRLDEPVPVDGIFYIGWLQSQEDLLNVGFDRNTDASQELWFNLGDAWLPSSLSGAVMMRPQGAPDIINYPFVSGLPAPQASESFRIWPNPSRDWVYWETLSASRSGEDTWVQLHAPDGRVLRRSRVMDGRMDLSGLPAGLYHLEWTALPEPTETRSRKAIRRTARLVLQP